MRRRVRVYSLLRWLIVLFPLLLLPFSSVASKEYLVPLDIGEVEYEYLANNCQVIDLDNDEGFFLLEPYLDSTVVYLTGELHFSQRSKEWELFLLRYLYGEAGVRVLLIEAPYSVGYFLNQYVNGDELRVSIKWPSIREYFSQVRDFNLDLPQEERITIVGIEAEFDLELATSLLDELLRENRMADFWRVVRGLEQQRHIRSLLETEGLFASLAQRERYSYLNFVELYKQMDNTRFFGQWGAAHVYQREYNQIAWLGAHLNSSDSPVAGRVLTIQCGHSGTFTSGGQYPILEGKNVTLQELFSGDVTLFCLTGKDSPFADNLYLIPRNTGGVTTDYMQFFAYFGALAPED